MGYLSRRQEIVMFLFKSWCEESGNKSKVHHDKAQPCFGLKTETKE